MRCFLAAGSLQFGSRTSRSLQNLLWRCYCTDMAMPVPCSLSSSQHCSDIQAARLFNAATAVQFVSTRHVGRQQSCQRPTSTPILLHVQERVYMQPSVTRTGRILTRGHRSKACARPHLCHRFLRRAPQPSCCRQQANS